MGISIQRRRGTTTQHSSFTGKSGEITVDTTKWVAIIHDGSTVGGFALAREVHTHANATTSVAGFMSSTDKTKLDGISGSTINYQLAQSNGTPQTTRNAFNFSPNFALVDDGAGNRTSIDLSDSGVGPGTYTKLVVNAKGRITGATLLNAGDIPNLTSSKITDFISSVQTVKLDQLTSPISDINLNSNKIINLADPVSATDAATKQYVDATATGLTFKDSCRVASTGNVNVAAPGTTIDAVTLVSGDRILLKNQTDPTQNGIYIFNGASSTLTRSLDADSNFEVKSGMFLLVTEGNVNSRVSFVLATNGTINLGSTNLTFVPFSSTGTLTAGNGADITGTVISAKTASSSRIVVGSPGIDLATTGVTPGQYQQVTVDAYGRITGTTNAAWQPIAANLTSISALSLSGFAVRTGSGTYTSRTIQQGTGITITNGDGVLDNVLVSATPDSVLQKVKMSKNGTLIATRSEINLIEGSGVTITETDNSGSNRTDVTIAASGGGGAPTTSQYVTLANDATLSNERVLTQGAGISIIDGGAGNNVTISITTDLGSVP